MKHSTMVPAQLCLFGLTAAVLATGCASPSRVDFQRNEAREQARIQKRLQEIVDAVQMNDLARLDSYHAYGPKFTKFSTPLPGRQDAAAARKGEHDGLSAIQGIKMQLEGLQIDIFGEVGIATFVIHSNFSVSGKTMDKRDRATLVFAKDNGSWKIVHEHLSAIASTP